VKTGREGNEVFVEIRNSGEVIPEDIKTRIFDPFFTTKEMGQGTGLGLSISYNTVRQHGGRIEVKSDAKHGTAFRVWLPVDEGGEVSRVEQDSRPATTGASGRILIVDDEEPILSSLARLFRNQHEVHTASSGREALDLLRRDAGFDVILCDLMMSEISGMDVYERATRDHSGLARRFIFMTGGAFTPRAQTFFGRTRLPKFEKPIDADDLLDLIQQVLAKHPPGQD
jgi:CheY-like chemotaxis protein